MEYHEIGERFEYDGVVLEVVGLTGCASCFFNEYGECKLKDDQSIAVLIRETTREVSVTN